MNGGKIKLTLNSQLNNLEIEKYNVGPIICTSPNIDPHDGVDELIESLAFVKNIEKSLVDVDELIKDNEQPAYLIMAYHEIKRIMLKSLKESIDQSIEFFSKTGKCDNC